MGHGGCDEVLNSRWSRIMGVPVALGGLLCYGTILVMALFAGSRSFNDNRLLGTILATAALLAALSGLWFSGLQVFVLGSFCYYCLAIHTCGLVLAGLVLWSALHVRPQNTSASLTYASISGMRTTSSSTHASLTAIPGARRTSGPRLAERPLIGVAASAATALVAALIAVQWMFPTRTFETSKPELAATIDMTATADSSSAGSDELSPDAEEHVVNRPTDESTEDAITAGSDSNVESADETTADSTASNDTEADDAPSCRAK